MKKFFLIIAVPLIAVLGTFLALILLVNPNQFKPLIVEQVDQQLGMELTIEGDLGWQFFPSVGLSLGKTELKNPEGFNNENVFSVEQVAVEVDVMPLFSHTLKIGNIILDGATFNLETLPDGRTNLDSLTKVQTKPADANANTNTDVVEKETAAEEPASTGTAWDLDLDGVTITNGRFQIQDQQAGTVTTLSDVSFIMSQFAMDIWTKADFGLNGETNAQKFAAKGELEFKLEEGTFAYELRNIQFDASYNDAANTIESAKIALETFKYDQANKLSYAVKGDAAGTKFDMTGGSELTVDSAISMVKMANLGLDAVVEGETLPVSPMNISMQSGLDFDLTKQHLDFALKNLAVNNINVDGKLALTLADIPKIRFAFKSENIDLDEFLGLAQSTTEEQSTEESKPAESKPAPAQKPQEPDLTALAAIDLKGSFTIDQFKASNAKMQDVVTEVSVKDGIAKLDSFQSKLYQGTISASATLDGRKALASYMIKARIADVKVQPLLEDVLANKMLEGTGNISLDMKGKGLTPDTINRNLVGTVGIKFADGAVNGINVAQLIRENYAKFKGQKVEASTETAKTDFSELAASISVDKGTVHTNNLSAQSPLLRLNGKGGANYIDQTVDFTLSTSVVRTLEGQGGKGIEELKGVTIPVNISGEWAKPQFKLVLDDVLKQKAQKEIDRGIDRLTDKIKNEDAKKAVDGLLKGLFN